MRIRTRTALALLALCTFGVALAADAPDIVIADFEAKDYGDWKVTGQAFGPGPARGTLAGQMPVSGYEGKGLVNTFYHGDDTTGTLTSPAFAVQRRYVNFLIGGGKYPGEACINLSVDGKIVRTATGPNDRPGGSEQLDWHTWDVAEFIGKQAVIQIVDQRTGGWGHVNVDHIYQSDTKVAVEKSRQIVLDGSYLHIPVKTGAAKRRLSVIVDGKTVRQFDVELAAGEPGFQAFLDVSAFKGKTATLELDTARSAKALGAVTASDTIADDAALYQQTHRPQFHFTSRVGWLNDPNGLVYHDGQWHLFYQHNPYGWNWGNMHWGHATSTDLLHWREQPIALYPQRYGDWCFSGSAVIDAANTSGLAEGGGAVMVAAYTSTGRGEAIAYSNDGGRSFTDYEANPVVKHAGRDPKVIWHEPTKRWVMALYDEFDKKRWIAFHSSADLKSWRFESRIEGFFECPDFFELPVDGDSGKTKWVLYAADGKYILGRFDGHAFHKESGKHELWFGNFYAAQTYANAPDHRRVQIGWGRGISFPAMPFNQQMTIPVELTLRTTDAGVRLFAEPVKELASIRGKQHTWSDLSLKAGDNPLAAVRGDLFELRADFEPANAESFALNVRGVPVVYDTKSGVLSCKAVRAPVKPVAGRVRLHVLVDRGSIEVFANGGRVAMSVGVIPPDDNRSLATVVHGGPVRVHWLDVTELRSVWR